MRGKSAGVTCRNQANHGDYCAKHKKKPKAALATDEVFGTEKTEKTEKPQPKVKQNHSVWMYTLNSQQAFSGMTKEQKTEFKELVKFIFDEENITEYLTDRKSPDDPSKNIVSLKSEYFFEVGDEQGRLHVHGILKITHTGNYQVNQAAVRQLAEKVLGYKPHFNINGQVSGNPVFTYPKNLDKL
eukprot:TRINITY_DN358_c1_g1_i7.p1 TRINITY_DN358_c1_g1~~TRINITY_DN358_c1_g1_i7.p1  ORF type:complete len:205 (+),score=33.76 TRINITY_DN358_c1_g1_i7:61-615(+)